MGSMTFPHWDTIKVYSSQIGHLWQTTEIISSASSLALRGYWQEHRWLQAAVRLKNPSQHGPHSQNVHLGTGLADSSVDQSLLAPAIVTVYIILGGGVAELVDLVTFRSIHGLVSFIYFLSLVCFLPALLYLSPTSRRKCFNPEKITMGTKWLWTVLCWGRSLSGTLKRTVGLGDVEWGLFYLSNKIVLLLH